MLYALSSAKNFYHINDYIEQTEDNVLIKSLSVQSDNDYIIPMFNAGYKLKELYNIDINLSSYKNSCFVYIKNKTLLGYVYSDNKNIKYEVFDNEMKSDISLKLSDAFNCYKENSHLLNSISFEQARKVNVY